MRLPEPNRIARPPTDRRRGIRACVQLGFTKPCFTKPMFHETMFREAMCRKTRCRKTRLLPMPQRATLNSFTAPIGGAMFQTRILRTIIFAVLIASVALAQTAPKAAPAKTKSTQGKATPTLQEAEAFMKKAEDQAEDLGVRAGRASWVQENFITDDTEILSAQAQEKLTAVITQLALDARRFDGMKMPPELARKFKLLKLSLTAPAPNNDAERKELTTIAASLDGDYGKGKYCKQQADGREKCLSLGDLSRILANSTNPDELLDAWVGWHKISPPMRKKYARFVELSNKGARELGFKDTGAMWRTNYDMSPEEFSAEVERLWRQVEPFYVSLHTYVRKQLIKKYGKIAERPDGMIPSHLLSNMLAPECGTVYPLVAPANSDK